MDHQFIDLDQIRLHAVSAGSGPLVVFLHGFPEFWYSWRHQLPALAAAGYRALAIDLRGYNESAKPTGIAAYAVGEVVADIVALVHNEGVSRVCLVGHDWGGVIAWRVAARHPELISKLAVLNAPHPMVYARTLRASFAQWVRSSYMGLFQVPGLAESILRAGDFWLIERTFRQAASSSAFSAVDIDQYKQALAVSGALTGGLNYYRAALWHATSLYSEPQVVTVPTFVIWGERDPYLSVELLRGLKRWVTNLEIERIPEVGHWVQNEAPDRVNASLLRFLGASSSTST